MSTELLDLTANCAALTKNYGNNNNYTLLISRCQFKQLAVVPGGTTTGATVTTDYFDVFGNIIGQGTINIEPNNTVVLTFVQRNCVCCRQVDQFVSLIFKFTSITADNNSVVFGLTFDPASNIPNSQRYLCTKCLKFVNVSLILTEETDEDVVNAFNR
jgi:hypothetical protein